MDIQKWEIAQAAAAKIVDDGMSWASAKRHAAEDLGFSARTALPDNAVVLQAVREHIALYCPTEQAEALRDLRAVAARWMRRMAAYRPHLTGAVWLGVATHWSDIHLDLYCDDPKMPEIDLLNQGIAFDTGESTGAKGEPLAQLIVLERPTGWTSGVAVIMTLRDADDVRGALKADKHGQAPRGDLEDLLILMNESEPTP